ncbi:GNAT family N-acetyltransferase [Cellulomonas edaphi]|uniref:GNAT family N-acetyltransferase n=1 Tax=Cellulomonas edaphi TaxID=3053468 RepID=A0ABT7S3K5_9CELL|nr:GNAT family N-acetyltransferase [Cellulomons edaphi]MDM7830109.1 GNAT family N-acetyltransferase [Cellulomons edaphi]
METSLAAGYALRAEPPPVDDYVHLRTAAGLRPKSTAEARAALRGSWSCCHVVTAAGATVAMGRVIGDGGWYFLVADMATEPVHQRRGLGSVVLAHLLADIRQRAPGEPYVTLTADDAGRRLYAQAGFTPFTADQTGMQLVLRRG